MNLRFKLGEMALLVSEGWPMNLVQVVLVGPIRKGDYVMGKMCPADRDYVILNGSDGIGVVNDDNLRKIIDPDATETIEEDAEVYA